jgi:hypothetical protein
MQSSPGSRMAARQTNNSRPIRQPTPQLLSVPGHAYDLKVRRLFRTQILASGTGVQSIPIDVAFVRNLVHSELGVAAGTGGEAFALHGGRVYAQTAVGLTTTSVPGPVGVELGVRIFDHEENSGVANANLVSQFVDESSVSGVAAVKWLWPVNNRPTFNRATATTELFTIDVGSVLSAAGAGYPITLDLDIDYTRVSATPLSVVRSFFRDGKPTDQTFAQDHQTSSTTPESDQCNLNGQCPVTRVGTC